MLLDPDTESDVAYELCQLVGRAILPVRAGDDLGTAFFFATAGGGEYLLTSEALTRAPTGDVGLRPSVTEPADVAGDTLTVPDFVRGWCRPGTGAAVMPTAGLHELAESAGWRWRTQQVPEVIAADSDAIAGLGAEPGSAIVLALGVGEGGTRPLEVAIERYAREGDTVRLTADLPDGYVGAPVFAVLAGSDGEVGLSCLGLVLPADGDGHPVATFDTIRAAVADLAG
ncbi:hypothetical protein [Micromonospora thermarum]|uniref:Uncharacterized protein n=1 Tax=Micromonospora thermarum TaxID=2720024 RepID=A0ABX0Z6K5_9ACTN|nr:hypothetical protein [Micromonospora thermarum]NJP33103.1 hypothetical protein [Micromonospora thermarum]